MKISRNILILIILLSITEALLYNPQTFSQSGEAKTLEVGNEWVYHYENISQTSNYYIRKTVIGDTLIKQKNYAVIKIADWTGTKFLFERADSIKVYIISKSFIDSTLIDFNLNTGDSLNYYVVVTSYNGYYYGSNRKVIDIQYYREGLVHDEKLYIKGIGLSTEQYGGEAIDGAGFNLDLVTIKINNQIYGDTTLLAVSNNIDKHPLYFFLSQNYPNPFNPTTTISYSIPKPGLVTLKVYDILGREVETLVNENKLPGNYEVKFNAGNLASGVYFYRLQVEDYCAVRKLLLLM